MKGLEIVKRKAGALSAQDWMEIIEERRDTIVARLDDFTSPRLSDFELELPSRGVVTIASFRGDGDPRAEKRDVEITLPDGSLEDDVQGWFGGGSRKQFGEPIKVTQRGCVIFSWGLSRGGKWLLICWDLTYQEGEPWNEDSLEAVSVSTFEVNLRSMLDASREAPEHVCMRLSSIVYSWERSREEKLQQIRNIAAKFQDDDLAISSLGGMYAAIHWPKRGALPQR